MEPIQNHKRFSVSLIPFRKNAEGVYEYFLQMRDGNAPMYANQFGLFGGGIDEGEDMYTALMRETEEEIEYMPQAPRYFSRFEDARAFYNVFIDEVSADFETHITVNEGQYGKFLTRDEVVQNSTVAPHVIMVIDDLDRFLSK